jgi:hypothetical protein
MMGKGKGFFLLILGSFFLLQACSARVVVDETQEDKKLGKVCPEPRPEVCAQQYDPVCGQLRAGDSKTYSNWCTACSDEKVESYVPGECR